MGATHLELEEELVALLHQSSRTAEQAARELIVMELYRRAAVSSGKAAELLGISRLAFIHRAGQVGVAFFDMTKDEWAAERDRSEQL